MRACNDSLSFPEWMAMTSSLSGLLPMSIVVLVLFIATLSATASLGLSLNLHDFLIALVHISTNLSTGSNSPLGSSTSLASTNSLSACFSSGVSYS